MEQIQQARERICVAVGRHKVACLAAALRKGRMSVLVTDEMTIGEVLSITG
jgi:DNA-binding transcriptional regulator LsrR (DeoR family)